MIKNRDEIELQYTWDLTRMYESDEAFERRRSNYYRNKYSITESQRDRERRLMEEYLNEEE